MIRGRLDVWKYWAYCTTSSKCTPASNTYSKGNSQFGCWGYKCPVVHAWLPQPWLAGFHLPPPLTWFPPLFGLTNTRSGFIKGEGMGLIINGFHLLSCKTEVGALIRPALGWLVIHLQTRPRDDTHNQSATCAGRQTCRAHCQQLK